MKNYYVYGHWTKDTNELFYIGVGTRKDRMWVKKGRNDYWNKIVNKYGFEAHIICEGFTSRDEAVKEEVRLQEINKPRACLQYGDNHLQVISDTTRKKMSESAKARTTSCKGYIHSDEAKVKMSNSKSTPVSNCRGDVYKNTYEAGEVHGTYSSHICSALSGKRQSAGKYKDGTKIKWSKVS